MDDREYSGLKLWLKKHGCRRFKTSGDTLMCTCPMPDHDDTNPSFGVTIDRKGHGWFNCFSCNTKGRIDSLVRILEGHWATVEMFRDILGEGSPIPDIREYERNGKNKYEEINVWPEQILQDYNYCHPYWTSRGIQQETIQEFCLGWSPEKFSVTIPMRKLGSEELVGVCFRYVETDPNFPQDLREKLQRRLIQKYYYLPGSQPMISLFGTKTATDRMKPIYLFEGAIDALNFHQRTGNQAVARWGSKLHELQRNFLQRFSEVKIIADNDSKGQGQATARTALIQLIRDVRCSTWIVDSGHKDYTDALMDGVEEPKFIPMPDY